MPIPHRHRRPRRHPRRPARPPLARAVPALTPHERAVFELVVGFGR